MNHQLREISHPCMVVPWQCFPASPSRQYTSFIIIFSRKEGSTCCLAVWGTHSWGTPLNLSGYRRCALKLPRHGGAGLTQPEIHHLRDRTNPDHGIPKREGHVGSLPRRPGHGCRGWQELRHRGVTRDPLKPEGYAGRERKCHYPRPQDNHPGSPTPLSPTLPPPSLSVQALPPLLSHHLCPSHHPPILGDKAGCQQHLHFPRDRSYDQTLPAQPRGVKDPHPPAPHARPPVRSISLKRQGWNPFHPIPVEEKRGSALPFAFTIRFAKGWRGKCPLTPVPLPEPWSEIPKCVTPTHPLIPRQIPSPNTLQTQGKPPGSAGETSRRLHDGRERGGEEKPHSKESQEGGPWAGGKFLLLKMLREGRRKGNKKKNQMELEVTREVEEGKGEEGEEEGVKGEWEADEEGCSPSPGELEGGQPEDRLQGGYKRQDRDAEGPAASAQPRGDAPRSFAGSAENSLPKQPSRSGDAASHAPESAGAQGQLRMVPSLRPALLLLLLLKVRCFKSSSPVRALLPPPHHPSALHRLRPPQ